MNDQSEDGRLAALTRDLLGAKGLMEIAKGLLDALTPERRAQLAEQLIIQHSNYEISREVKRLLVEAITDEAKQRIKVAVQEQIHAAEEQIVKDIAREAKDAVAKSAREALRRW